MPNASSALISRERSSIRCSISGALVASMSSWLMTLWRPLEPSGPGGVMSCGKALGFTGDDQRLGGGLMGFGLDEGLGRRCGRRRRRVVRRDGLRRSQVSTCESTGLSISPICSASLTSFCSDVMKIAAGDMPVATSLTSSKLFFRSAISASRIASWNWPWNSAAIWRALPIHCPTMRSTPGSSFGPMAISATTADDDQFTPPDIEHETFRLRDPAPARIN